MTTTKRTTTPIADFNPFLDVDLPGETPVPISSVKPEFNFVDQSELQNVCFTIHDIVQIPNDNRHHDAPDFKWQFHVETTRGRKCAFELNPSQRRNKLINQLASKLPFRNMTLVEKNFIEQRAYKLVTYYELDVYNKVSGTISH